MPIFWVQVGLSSVCPARELFSFCLRQQEPLTDQRKIISKLKCLVTAGVLLRPVNLHILYAEHLLKPTSKQKRAAPKGIP